MNLLTPFACRLVGIAPMLQHNEILVDAMNPLVRVHKQLTTKRRKTEADLEAIKKSEWTLGMYREDDRPCVPVDWLLATIKEGARKNKLGKQAQSGIFPVCASFPLEYDGPKDLEGMWQSERFLDYRGIRNQAAKVMRARPRFDRWSVSVRLDVSEPVISCEDVITALKIAGATIGIGDYRPRFGRFAVELN
jgi:hypothetical protein